MTEITSEKYFVRKTYVYYDEPIDVEKGLLDTFYPITVTGTNYKNWHAILDLKTCIECRSMHGQIYKINETVDPEPPLHNNCRCKISEMESIYSGNATKNGKDGADYWLAYFGALPEYYVSTEVLEKLGWRYGNRPSKFAPGKCFQKVFMII